MFDEILPIQWLAYAALIRQDKQEEEDKWRDRLEYLARFWNNEAVEQIKQARAEEEVRGTTSDNQFSSFLQHTFGRGLGSAVPQHAKTIHQLGADIKQVGE